MTKIIQIAPFIGLFLCLNYSQAQDFRFGKVSKEELTESYFPGDSSVVAAVLYREIETMYRYVESDGFHVMTHVHERIKIYDKEGFNYATVSERLYKDNSDNESLTGIKAFTFNLENGSVKKTKMKGSEVFDKSLNKYRNETSFTLPDIKEGSVIEYQYTVNSPFSYSIDEIWLQLDIPIKKQKVMVAIPEYFKFKPRMKGYLPVVPKFEKRSGKINFTAKTNYSNSYTRNTSYSNESVDFIQNVTVYNMNDVPALQEEPFVNDMDNYRSSVNFELLYVDFPNTTRKDFTTTWDKVIDAIYESPRFGGQLSGSRYYKDDLQNLINESHSDIEKAALIFSFVQARMSWNGIRGYYTDLGVRKAYEEKSGNTADINLILVSMLRSAGLNSDPVLISTRDNGVPMFPTREGFNYVVASVKINGSVVLLDATNKFSIPNILPTHALNWYGRIVSKNGDHQVVNVSPAAPSKETHMMNVEMDDTGNLSGKLRMTCTNYNAFLFRNRYMNIATEDYLEKLENENSGIQITDYEIKNKLNMVKPIVEVFSFEGENQADIIGDEIYFRPLFQNSLSENPFKLDQRNYPIDFTFPWQEKYIVNIKIPEGYKASSIPESVKMVMKDDVGSFIYQIVEKGNSLQVLADIKINQAVIPPHHYDSLKEMFKKVVEKEAERVVLSKITPDGNSEGSKGGR